MQKFISVVLSILMLFFGIFIPGINQPDKTISQGEWLAKVDETFGMTSYESEVPYYAGVQPGNKYFAAVQTAYEWGVINSEDAIDVDANVTTEFAVATLVRVANLEAVEGQVIIKNAEDLKYAEEVAIAVAKGIVELSRNNTFKVVDIAYDDAVELLRIVYDMWINRDITPEPTCEVEYAKDVKKIESKEYEVIDDNKVALPADTEVAEGETIVLPSNSDNLGGSALKVENVTEKDGVKVVEGAPADEEAIKNVKFEGSVSPDLTCAEIRDNNGKLIQAASDNEGLLDTIKDKLGDKLKNISFSVGPVNVRASLNDNGFDIALGGSICQGVTIAEAFSVSNLDVQTKFDGNLAMKDIKQAYLLLDYDSVSTTAVAGSYLASLGSDYEGDTTGMSVLDQIKANFSNVSIKSNQIASIPVFTVNFAIPNCPEVTISLDVSILFTVSGQIQLVISSHSFRGYEIINNKGRFINETADKHITLQATGAAEATATLSLGVGILTYDLMDVSINGGVGAFVFVNVAFPGKDGGKQIAQVSDIPADIIAETVAVRDDADEIDVNGIVQFYGILYVAIGQNSLMGKVGLSKQWNIFDRSNGVFASWEF